MRLALALGLGLLTSGGVRAEADLAHIRPLPRPVFGTPLIHPMPRPASLGDPLASLRPMKRPDSSAQKPKTAAASGYLCESPEIMGKALPAIQARTKGCKVDAPVLVSEVAGVKLVPPATINCVEARALSKWVTTGLQPAFDGTIVRLNVADSYACRPRNNVPGNPVSVHGLGQAIDIAGFKTVSGATLTVAADYGRQIKAAQKAGCGIFHTILGPGSDGYHENHIHFDVAPHGGSDYCR